jgi:hypothetical protein
MDNKEIWKEVLGYEGIYKVSNLGRIKSLSRLILNPRGNYVTQDRILKNCCNTHGYVQFRLYIDKDIKTHSLQKIVAIAFLNHKPNGTNEIVVDHINNIKNDNRACNLQLITNRENSSKDKKGCSSKYTGVNLLKSKKKWTASIRINGNTLHLGTFKDEIEASNAYQSKLLTII